MKGKTLRKHAKRIGANKAKRIAFRDINTESVTNYAQIEYKVLAYTNFTQQQNVKIT